MQTFIHFILLVQLLTQKFISGNSTIIFTCCHSQGSYSSSESKCDKNSFSESSVLPFPKEIAWKIQDTNLTPLKSTTFLLKLYSALEVNLQSSQKLHIQITANKSQQINETRLYPDGYIFIPQSSLLISPTRYCVNRISSDDNKIEVFVLQPNEPLGKDKYLPKCCPWGSLSRWAHPEICKVRRPNATHMLIPANVAKSYMNYVYRPLNCIKIGKMVTTITLDIFNRTELDTTTNQLPDTDSFCIDDVVTSFDSNFNWSRNIALFYCDKDWPYKDFRVTELEGMVYGISLGLSATLLLVAIVIYTIKLKQTHCHVHTWIELFYMISLFMLAIFCILQINFPEDHLDLCTPYHFFSVFGYFLSAISVFSWATLLSVELFLAFKDLRPPLGSSFKEDLERLCFYTWVGHLFPLIFTVCTFTYSYFYWKGAGFCLDFELETTRIVLAVLLLINFVCCVFTLHLIFQHRRCAMLATGNRSTSKQRLNDLIQCFIKLYLICGITFAGIIFGYFTGTVRSSAWYYILYREFLNLRGVTIFVIFICNKKTKKFLMQLLKKEGLMCTCCPCKTDSPDFKSGIMQSTITRTLE